jgi:hypothetical protein
MVTPAKKTTATRKAAPRKKKAVKRQGAVRRIENAIMVGAVEIDELAASMGFLGSVPPKKPRKKAKR